MRRTSLLWRRRLRRRSRRPGRRRPRPMPRPQLLLLCARRWSILEVCGALTCTATSHHCRSDVVDAMVSAGHQQPSRPSSRTPAGARRDPCSPRPTTMVGTAAAPREASPLQAGRDCHAEGREGDGRRKALGESRESRCREENFG